MQDGRQGEECGAEHAKAPDRGKQSQTVNSLMAGDSEAAKPDGGGQARQDHSLARTEGEHSG